MKIKVKEVREWMKSLSENKWRKTYNVDAKRVAHFAKNIVEGEALVLPTYLQRKMEGYEYKREKRLAKEYAKVFKRKLKEGKLNEWKNPKGLNTIVDVLKKYTSENTMVIQSHHWTKLSNAINASKDLIKSKADKATFEKEVKKELKGIKIEGNARRKVRAIIREIIKEETEYQKFFKTVLDKFDVKSPNELSDEKKKEFFNYIDKNWNSSKESGEDGEIEEMLSIDEEESRAAKQAKAKGLVSKGFGNWADPKSGEVVASTKGGKLTAVKGKGKRGAKKDNISKIGDADKSQGEMFKDFRAHLEKGTPQEAGKRIAKTIKKYGPVIDSISKKAEKFADNPDKAPRNLRNTVFKLNALMSAADDIEIEHENQDEIYQASKKYKEKTNDLFTNFFV